MIIWTFPIPAHGGSDPGTIHNGITEKDYTLKISNYIKDRLDDLGIENAMTRTGDEALDQNSRPQRVQSFFGNGNDVIVVSNHLNSGGGDGAEIIYALRNSDNLSRKIANEFEAVGQNVRKYYQRRLPSDPSKDYYYMHRNTPNNETIIVEYGFTDSTGDDVNLIKNNWETLAEAVVKGLANYIGVPYSVPGENYYTVQKGDSLWSIAKKFGTTVDKLKELNNLSTNALSIGQKLITSAGGASTGNYIVQKGDTLYGIANKFNTTVNAIMDLNNLSTTALSIGQTLKLPTSEPKPETPIVSGNTYTVKPGDTLYAIARANGTTVDDLIKANNLSTANLSIGQVLIIPSTYKTIYKVKAGDTLYGIASKYNTTVDALKKANNLSSNMLSIGQELKIM